MTIIVKCGIGFLNVIFFFMKCLPVQNKITYISRQMDTTPVDFEMVKEQMIQDHPEYKHVILAKMIHQGLFSKIGYIFHMFRQMYHIATSKAVILDTYCIPISILKQRDSLVVIQMWHALGAFKKFGYSILDKQEGSSSKMAKLMSMHRHYTYVLTSSVAALPYFAEAFDVDKSQMKVYPLPKTDLLVNKAYAKEIMNQIETAYPRLRHTHKEILVYAPTFRKTHDHLKEAIEALIEQVNFTRYELVIKLHPLTKFTISDPRVIVDTKFSSLEFFYAADAIITDYSAVLFEACMLKKPIYFYAFDYDVYTKSRSFYIDYQAHMPGPICFTAKALISAINRRDADVQKVEDFADLMVAPCKRSYTKDFCDFLVSSLKS